MDKARGGEAVALRELSVSDNVLECCPEFLTCRSAYGKRTRPLQKEARSGEFRIRSNYGVGKLHVYESRMEESSRNDHACIPTRSWLWNPRNHGGHAVMMELFSLGLQRSTQPCQ